MNFLSFSGRYFGRAYVVLGDGTRKKVYTRFLAFEMCCVFLTDVSRKEAVLHWLAGRGKRQAQGAFEP
jgi:hypothetical protein